MIGRPLWFRLCIGTGCGGYFSGYDSNLLVGRFGLTVNGIELDGVIARCETEEELTVVTSGNFALNATGSCIGTGDINLYGTSIAVVASQIESCVLLFVGTEYFFVPVIDTGVVSGL